MNLSAPFIRRPVAHDAADGRRSRWRARSASSCCRSRRCRRSTSRRSRSSAGAARREPGDDGLGGRDAARAAVRPHRRRHRDDLVQLARLDAASRCSSISTATSTAPRATCRRRSTRRAASCRPTCRTIPTYRKVNPADAPIMILALTSDTCAAGADVRRRLDRSCSRSSRRSTGVGPGDRRRRRAAGGARRAQSDRAQQATGSASRTCARRSPPPTPTARRAQLGDGRAAWAIAHQRPAAATPRSTGR